jgi:phytoene synthase
VSDALKITRRAKSNLAFALRILPPERRDDAVIFYAYCRTLDDLADDPGIPAGQRAEALGRWKQGLVSGFDQPSTLQQELIGLRQRHQIPNELLVAIVDGCLMDLEPRRFQTWKQLDDYIWKVACAVGLVSIRIFGCKDSAAETYAVNLGRALQLTNILRDIREDHDNGQRIYLPLDDMARFDYTEADLSSRVCDGRFRALMEFEARRADDYFREAASVMPAADRRALAPARIMSAIYQELLAKMRRDGFRVFEKRYRVSGIHKLAILAQHGIAG